MVLRGLRMKEFFINIFNLLLEHVRLQRKGVSAILFTIITIAILYDVFYSHHPIDFTGSLMQQIIYILWIFSIFSLLKQFYNEYCDKKDAEKLKQEQIKEKEREQLKNIEKAKNRINEYFEMFDLCSDEEKDILCLFYCKQNTTVDVNNVAIIRAMHNKGLSFLTYEGSFDHCGKALCSATGLKIINKYFDNKKENFFKFLNRLEEKEINLLKDFYSVDNNIITLYKREIRIAKSIIKKFNSENYDNIYIYSDNKYFEISNLYFAYLKKYFQT